MPKLSIITINLNNKVGLEKTINSVVSQTYTDFEYIIIDGGSKDGSLDVIEKYKKHFSYWVSEPDKGIYNAMNKGIAVAKGEYCLFLNSGDCLYETQVLESVFKLNPNQDIIYCDTYYAYPTGELKLLKSPDIVTLDFLAGNILFHQSMFIRTKLFDEIGMYDESFKISADWEFYAKAILKNNVSYKHVNIAITVFDVSGISANSHFEELRKNESLKAKLKIFPLFVWETAIELYQLKFQYNGIINSKSYKLIALLNKYNPFQLVKKLTGYIFPKR